MSRISIQILTIVDSIYYMSIMLVAKFVIFLTIIFYKIKNYVPFDLTLYYIKLNIHINLNKMKNNALDKVNITKLFSKETLTEIREVGSSPSKMI